MIQWAFRPTILTYEKLQTSEFHPTSWLYALVNFWTTRSYWLYFGHFFIFFRSYCRLARYILGMRDSAQYILKISPLKPNTRTFLWGLFHKNDKAPKNHKLRLMQEPRSGSKIYVERGFLFETSLRNRLQFLLLTLSQFKRIN